VRGRATHGSPAQRSSSAWRRAARGWLVLSVWAGVGGCLSSADTGAAAAPAYLQLAEQDDLPTLDPALGYDTASWQFEEMLFNTLLDYDARGVLAAELATDWEIDADGRAYIFHLRDDVRFSNGRPVQAADIRFAIERVLDPRTRSPGAEFFRGIAGADACRAGTCSVTGIEAVDALFLHKLAMPFAAAVPAEAVQQWGEDFARHPVGSGPYVLQEWVTGQRVVVRRNPAYFLPAVPRLAGVNRLVGVSEQLQWLKYEAGQLDVSTIPPAEFVSVMRTPRLQPLIYRETTMRTNYLGMNCRMPPFTDRRVRQALNYAVNKEKLLRLINDRGVVATGIVPPNMPGYHADIHGYGFDPARARTLLRAAGYGDGFSTTLWLRHDETLLRLAQSVQQDLADVGVHIDIKPLAWGPFLEAVRIGNIVPFFFLGWEADFPDPSNFLEVLFHTKHIGTNNNENYSDPPVDRLLDEAAHTIDTPERFRLLEEAEQRIVDDAPMVFLYHPVSYRIVNPRVRDFRMHPFRPERYEHVWLEDAPAATAP
jgi:ABC-type transport system substrate-binding protein